MFNNYSSNDIHAQVEELLPFFVAGTLPPQEGDFVRQHLAACPRCKQSLTEWFEIAHAVRTEAASWSTKLPPLSPRVRARLRSSKTVTNSSSRFNRLSLTLVAAMITVVFISGVLLYSRNRGDNTEVAAAPTETQTVIPPTFTAAITATPEVSSTPTLTIPTLDPALQPALPTQQPTEIASSKLPASATPQPPAATPLPPLQRRHWGSAY
ncbi:MAG: zf-HC2 domain-containing protein [Anaerolineae bacterium]